ncbi:unnamed protein product [Prorocentrum cordatum]|uniref:Uncharacterized protein n=1 Tax=Prorocentrum cordatum TaxID=2364126 RepID=A0ABN9RU59_9DINO|nr:unnamed protein product [Polarella glacialis]
MRLPGWSPGGADEEDKEGRDGLLLLLLFLLLLLPGPFLNRILDRGGRAAVVSASPPAILSASAPALGRALRGAAVVRPRPCRRQGQTCVQSRLDAASCSSRARLK